MEIKQFVWNVVDSNSWLLLEGNRGLLIDVVDDQGLFEKVRELDDLIIVLTHAHFDHIIGLNEVRKQGVNTSVISTKACSVYLGNIYRNMSSTATAFLNFYENGKGKDVVVAPFTCDSAERVFEEEMELIWCGHEVKLKAMYGHSDDSLLAIVDNKMVFSGDTLLNIPTVTRFPKGSKNRFWDEDVPKMKALESVEVVYPGHGNPGEISDMLANNVR